MIYGGPSAEHEVSCVSARRIVETALDGGWSVTVIGLTHDKRWVNANAVLVDVAAGDALDSPDELMLKYPDAELAHLDAGLPAGAVVFPVLHGPFGEDGVIQGHLEALGVPYVGAGVLSSSICMDKGIAKSVLRDHGIPVAAWRVAGRSSWTTDVMEEVVGALGLPVFVKPANLGSSIGVTKVTDTAALGDSVRHAFEFDDHVILEEYVRGRELELSVMGNEDVRVSQAGEILASREFYDYEDKYLLGAAETVAPTDLTPAQLARAQELAEAAYRGIARRRPGPRRHVPHGRRRHRRQRGQHHAGLHAHLHVPHALGGRGPLLRRRRRGAGGTGAGPACPPPGPTYPPSRLRRDDRAGVSGAPPAAPPP